jgi:nitrite reductase/ring-hydroxylating ferredoxin subunit
MDEAVALCPTQDLQERGLAVPFDVVHGGQTCRGFAVRFENKVYAYLNRCAHVAMEMDFQPNQFWDETRQWLMCATHGAVYDPVTGDCRGGPCRGGLIPIQTSESDGWVFWHTAYNLKPLEF